MPRNSLLSTWQPSPALIRLPQDFVHLAGLVREHDEGDQVSGDAEDGRDAAVARRARL